MDSILEYERKPEEDFYNILGVDELSDIEQINCEYKLRARECHPDKQPNNPKAAEQFALLQEAKETLCDPEKRAQYDTWRRSGIAVPYREWCARKDAIQTSMHWASKKKKEPMIEARPSTSHMQQNSHSHLVGRGSCSSDYARDYWQSAAPSDVIKKFRNYEI